MSTTKLSPEQWATIRGEREAGASFGELARRHGVSKSSIVQRSTAEGWADGSEGRAEIRKRATERALLTGAPGVTVPTGRAQKAAAIEPAAETGAAVILKHQAEWAEHRRRFTLEAIRADFEIGKAAKISAEMLLIRQTGERKAHALDADTGQTITIDRGPVIYLPANGR